MMTLRYAVITVALALIVGALILVLTGCNGVGTMQANPNEYDHSFEWMTMRPL